MPHDGPAFCLDQKRSWREVITQRYSRLIGIDFNFKAKYCMQTPAGLISFHSAQTDIVAPDDRYRAIDADEYIIT